jgi:UDP-2,4-diacetamido-2,4,6-trideoxy-beta-L-altropyranose hydrolase
MRCRALAEASRKSGVEVTFILTPSKGAGVGILRDAGFTVLPWEASLGEDLKQLSQFLSVHEADVLVVDGYRATGTYLAALRPLAGLLVSIDDLAEMYFPSHVVINQNIYAENLTYSCAPDTHLLLGTRYALLREQFEPWRSWTRMIPVEGKRLLIMLGGVDPENQTGRVIEIIRRGAVPGLEVVAVVGGDSSHLLAIQAAAVKSHVPIRVVHAPSHVSDLMAWADVAVSGAGSTCWELAFMGLPALTLVLSQNQQKGAAGLAAAGASCNLGWYRDSADEEIQNALFALLGDRAKRAEMSERGRHLVDGRGSERVAEMLAAGVFV